jgi:hypothetical protein
MKLHATRSFEGVEQRTRTPVWRIGIGIALGVLLLTVTSVGQETKARELPKVRGVSPAPYSHVYMHFLLYQNHLDKAAADREKVGKDGAWLRDHFQKKLGFTPEEFALIRASAHRMDSKLNANRSQAMIVIQNDRAARLTDSSSSQLRIVPSPELKSLAKQREEMIQREEADLDRKLGPDAAAKLQKFLKNDFVRNEGHQSPLGPPPMARHKLVQP